MSPNRQFLLVFCSYFWTSSNDYDELMINDLADFDDDEEDIDGRIRANCMRGTPRNNYTLISYLDKESR